MADNSYLIAGCGVSGRAAARLASFMKYDYFLADEKDTPELRAFEKSLEYPPHGVIFGWKPGMELPRVTKTVVSPGIRSGNPFRTELEKVSGELTGELDFALSLLPCPFVGITGTNGKTTVTELTTELFRAAGVKAVSAGNIGDALSDIVIRAIGGGVELAVIEISSFQLETMHFPHPAAATVLNLASDHIDRHGSMEEYAKIKFKLMRAMKENCILNHNLRGVARRFLHDDVQRLTFSAYKPTAFYSLRGDRICRDGKDLFLFSSLKLKGMHNAENVLASLALLDAVKGVNAVRSPAVFKALASFEPAPHRMQTFLEKNGISYIDDSKATNPHSTNAALDAIPRDRKVLLILGGLDKAMDFTELDGHTSRVRRAYLVGRAAETIRTALRHRFSMVSCGTFEEAVRSACSSARKGDVVMLSPACASMDMFRDYKERGDVFQRLVREIVDPAPADAEKAK